MESSGQIDFTNYSVDSLDEYDRARRVVGVLRAHNFEAYIIGGAVRDMLLGIPPKDFDIVTNATPADIVTMPEFALAKYKDTAQAFGVTRVQLADAAEKGVIEIATFRKDINAHVGRKATKVEFTDLRGDMCRRDLTINALALNPFTNQVVDHVGGIDDIERGIVRFIGNPARRIQEDPLRIMRAVRFKNRLSFSYDDEAVHAIVWAVSHGFIARIAVDRLREEMTYVLQHPSRRNAIVDLDNFDALGRILPEVTAGKGVQQQPEFHGEGDVWVHQLLTLDNLPEYPSRRLVWAALLHDIGKPATRAMPLDGSDRVHFDRHYAVGAEMAKTVLRRLHFSNQDIQAITWIIYNHMSIDDLPVMRPSHRQRMMSHPAFPELLELHRADAMASVRAGVGAGGSPDFSAIELLWREHQANSATHSRSLKHDLGIDGNWLLLRFGRDFDLRGPVIGEVLRELNDWYIDGDVRDERAYVARARHLLEGRKMGKCQ